MRKNVYGRRFKRDKNERTALFKGLLSALVLEERIRTTEPKAKSIKGDADKMITKVKKNGEQARRFLGGILNSKALDKLMTDIAPRFKNRSGGYTRIIRVGRRFGDNAMEVIMEWTEQPKGLTAAPSPTPAAAAHKTKSKSKRPSRSLSERRSQSSTKKSINSRRRSVAPRSGKGTAQKNSKKK